LVVERITVTAKQMGGVPCIRGLRIPVATVVGMIANGMTADEVVVELPPLALEDVAAALRLRLMLSPIVRSHFDRRREVPRRSEPVASSGRVATRCRP
jgi:uncharacterized protein (DUF433 family)